MKSLIDKINWKQPKYVLPAILYPLVLITGYLIFDIFDTEIAEKDNGLESTEYLNAKLPDAQTGGKDIGGKYENMLKSYGKIQDRSAVENIDRDNIDEMTEDYNSKYTDEDIAMLDEEAAARMEELQRQNELKKRLAESAAKGREMGLSDYDLDLDNDSLRIARNEERHQEALAELNKALAEARLKGQQKMDESGEALNNQTQEEQLAQIAVTGTIEMTKQGVNALPDDAAAEQVVKKVKVSSDYFNTLAENEPEAKLIKAIIDEDIKAVDGSRVRLRLLDDVEINEVTVPKGSYLYATMSGFGSQRVKGSIKSLLIEDELIKVSLAIYDTDGMEGLYVPQSSFRETGKEVASNALNSNMNINSGGSSRDAFSQWGMQAIQNAYQRTSNAVSKAISKNKVKLKYGTFVYLVNTKEKRNQ